MPSSFRLSPFLANFALVCSVFLPAPGPSAAHGQEIPGRRLPDIHIVARFQDGYWQWYHQYLQRRDEQRQRITEIRMQLGVIATERKKLRAEWMRFLYLENQLTPASEYDPGWAAFWASLIGVSSVGDIAGEARREIDRIAFRWSAGLFGAALVSGESAGRQIEASYQGERDLRRARINQWKETQRQLIEEALRLNRELAALCASQKEKSGGRRPWLNAEAERLDDELTILRMQLYDAAQWYLPEELPALIAALDPGSTATEEVAALLRAKVHLATAAWNDEKTWLQMTSPRQAPPDPQWILRARRPRLEAIADLRRVLRLNPGNMEARGMLIDAELWWLREIAAKLDLERRASLEAFKQYLSNRGFYADQPGDWTQDLFEVGAVLWGLGPIAMWSGLPGLNVAAARATELDVTQTAAARNQVSLLAVMRLVKNGVPLREIATLRPDELAGRMTLHTADGRTLPAAQARRVFQDIRDTISDLRDLQLLASSDEEFLAEDVNAAFGRTYYAPLDPTYTLYESVGDLLNIHNVAFLWGPSSIVKIDNKWQFLPYLKYDTIAALEQAGKLLTSRQAFLSLTRLDRLAETIASTSLGSRWAKLLAADRAATRGLGTVDMVVDLGTRFASAMILYAGATYLAQEAGIPGAAILIELLGEIGPGELFSDVIRRSGSSPEAIARRLEEVSELLARQRDELAASRKFLDEVSNLVGEMSQKPPAATRQAAIQRRLGEITAQMEKGAATRQAGSVAEPVDRATSATVEALRRGDIAEAAPAATGGAEIAKGAQGRINDAIERLAAARARVNAAAGTRVRSAALDVPRQPAKPVRELGSPDKFWRPDLYAPTGPGRSLQLGDEAIRRGDLESAAGHFRAARKQAEIDPAGSLPHLDQARNRLELVVNAQRAGDDLADLRKSLPDGNAMRAIDERSAAEAMENLDGDLKAGTARASRSLNPVDVTRDSAGNVYYVKRIEPTPGSTLTQNLSPEDIERILATEAAGSALAARVGLNTPAARYDPQHRVLITRAVPSGGPAAGRLSDMPEHVILALRKEYAQQRLFRAWLGDSDGHLGNMILGDDGRLYLIDFDMAVLSGTTSRQIIGTAGQSERDLLDMTVAIWADVGRQPERAMYRWVARLDQTISYADARETAEAIQKLVAEPGELRRILAGAGYPDIGGAVKSLTERAGLLEKVLRPLFDGGLLTRGVAWLRFRLGSRPARHFAADMRLSVALPRAA